MEQTFTSDGKRIPVTHIDTTNCYLIGVKTQEKDGYVSLILGFGIKKNIKKPVFGQLKKAGIDKSLAWIKEVRLKKNIDIIQFNPDKKALKIKDKEFVIGQEINPEDMFIIKDKVAVTGVSKGKGFAGVVKRHRFAGGPRTHGQSDRERAPGSIGQTTTPGRVYKGKRMAGRMGGNKITMKNLPVVDIKDKLLIVKGAVPGPNGGNLLIRLD